MHGMPTHNSTCSCVLTLLDFSFFKAASPVDWTCKLGQLRKKRRRDSWNQLKRIVSVDLEVVL